MSSFRNPVSFDRELNFKCSKVRRYSISVNALTLDKLLSRLSEEVHVPEQEEEILRAVSVVGKNRGISGQPVWCLNRDISVGSDGCALKASDFGLEWISHITDPVNGGEIADESLAALVDGELTNVYFDAMAHFLAGSLEKKAEEDVRLKAVVSELFGHDERLCFQQRETENVTEEIESIREDGNSEQLPQQGRSLETQRDNFLSQFYLASMGVIMANYQEVSIVYNKC